MSDMTGAKIWTQGVLGCCFPTGNQITANLHWLSKLASSTNSSTWLCHVLQRQIPHGTDRNLVVMQGCTPENEDTVALILLLSPM